MNPRLRARSSSENFPSGLTRIANCTASSLELIRAQLLGVERQERFAVGHHVGGDLIGQVPHEFWINRILLTGGVPGMPRQRVTGSSAGSGSPINVCRGGLVGVRRRRRISAGVTRIRSAMALVITVATSGLSGGETAV